MIHAKVLKPFAGLEEGRITELNDADFAKLEASGHVAKEDAGKASTSTKKSSDKKADKL